MNTLPVSVVVVSRGRPEALKRCLTGLSQLQYGAFEVIVVADPGGLAAAQELPFADALKLVEYNEPNISAARNLGLTHAAGDIVAYIDDDAVPEPSWLHHLTRPAAQEKVAAMGGYVRGRNGISFQWTARSIDADGLDHPLEIDPHQPTLLTPPAGRAIKTQGTNMAFRRDVLTGLGGFDPAFHYFLDETDLNVRLARAGHVTALVPLAQVHHGYAANRMRSAARVPVDLFDIGASWAVFQRKHLEKNSHKDHWQARRAGERRRLLSHMVKGTLEPRDISRLMQRLELGYAEGQTRRIEASKLAAHPVSAFLPFPSVTRVASYLPCRISNLRKTRANAAARVKGAEAITVFAFSPTALYHHVCFEDDGVWVQRGGIFGRSARYQPLFRFTTLRRRAREEWQRVAEIREVSPQIAAKN